MRPPDMFRALTPLGWGVAILLASAAALALGHGLGLRWDPFGLAERRLAVAETRATAAESDAAARRLEVEGAGAQARRLEIHHQQAASVARETGRAEAHARSAHDASISLDPARAARLRELDRRMCDLSPAVCAAAAPDPARSGDHAVPAGPPA